MSHLDRLGLSAATPFQSARARLLGWGALMAGIYLVYVIFFPLVPTINRPGAVLDIEMMLRHGRRWFGPLYVLGILALFFAFWRVMLIARTLSKQDPGAAKSLRSWVLGVGLLCGAILLWLYPITALDVALYVVRARLWALYGASPMIAHPASFPHDPYIALAGEYAKDTTGYGPLWELVAQIPMQLGILDMAGGILAMKVISLISYAAMAVLLGWYARQEVSSEGVSSLTMVTFLALNPLVLMQAMGNGHNDMLLLALMTLGLVLWQRGHWGWAAFALAQATLVKVTGLILLPLFGMAVLVAAPDWRTRIRRGLGIAAIFLLTTGIAYRLLGPFPTVFEGMLHATFGRAGFSPDYLFRVIFQEFFSPAVIARLSRELSRGLFILVYLYLLFRMAQRKMTLVEAGFAAYFSQLLLGTTFRIWYPMWLIPFAALHLAERTYWRTFLFGLTAELSILMYYILWRWQLRSWDWGVNGPLSGYWDYWLVMTVLTVPWTFGLPLFGPMLIHRGLTPDPIELE